MSHDDPQPERPDAAPAYTAEDITWATRRLDIAMSRLMVAFSRAVGISVPEMLALEHLDTDGGLGPSDLARRLQMTTGAVTALNGTLTAGGIAGLAEGAFKKADVAAEGTLEADADAALEGLVAKVISLAQAYAAPAAAPPAPEVPPTTETPAQ